MFAAIQTATSLNELKRLFQPRFGLSARQFNAMRIGLEGKIKSIKERQPELIKETERRVNKAIKTIANLEKKASACGSNKLHQKKRRLKILQDRLAKMNADYEVGIVRLCFGSKRLFHAQFNLEANNYASHEDWKEDWCNSRLNQFFVIGSKDEKHGCLNCQAVQTKDGSLNLQLRFPNSNMFANKYLTIADVNFVYGQKEILAALNSAQRINSQTKDGKAIVKRTGTALSYRFMCDDKGWRVFVSTTIQPVTQVSSKHLGAIGIDINAESLAISETDRFGNLIFTTRIDLMAYGKTPNQTKAIIGDAAVLIVKQAQAAGKPIVIENLNFQKKKAELETTDVKQSRLLSSFAYNKIISFIKSVAFRHGVEVIEVNPAYTSIIGAVNYAQRYGISTHQGAAYAIARRGLGLSERPTMREAITPTRNGGHVTFALPVIPFFIRNGNN